MSLYIQDPQLSVSSLLREPVIGILWGEMFQTNQLTLPAESSIPLYGDPALYQCMNELLVLMSSANDHHYTAVENSPYPFSLSITLAEHCNNPHGPSKIFAHICAD